MLENDVYQKEILQVSYKKMNLFLVRNAKGIRKGKFRVETEIR